MQAFTMIAGIIVAAVGQKLNSMPKVPTVFVKLALALLGPILYLVLDSPDAFTRAAFLAWLDRSWVWALALPGLASLIGLTPGMATRNGAIKAIVLAVALACGMTAPAAAQSISGSTPVAASSLANILRVYVGANALWVDQNDALTRDFEAGGSASASLSPHIAAVSSLWYGFENTYFRYAVGARVTATDAEDTRFSVGLGVQWQSANEDLLRPSEWAPDASFGWRAFGPPLAPGAKPVELQRLILVGQGSYGLSSNQARAFIGLRYLLPLF